MPSFVALALFTIFLQSAVGQQANRLYFFDIDLLKAAAEQKPGNVMVSSASIRSTLAMLLEGAEGVTEAEIRSALRLAPNKKDYTEQLFTYLESLKANSSGTVLRNANSLFVSDKLKLKKEYESAVKDVYSTDIYKMNFSNPDYSTNFINKWVFNKTSGLISDIVDPVSVNPSTEMLVTNALYFKGVWKNPFDPQLTRSECFHYKGACKNVSMMDLRAQLNYAFVPELRSHAVELPYQGDRYSMILLVPVDRDGCPQLIRDLPYLSLQQVAQVMEPSDVQLSLPKFTVDYAEDMVAALRSLRIISLFSSSPNLSGIFEGDSPQFNSMYHKVHMTVDEQGTVAAAASVGMVVPLIENGVQLTVDRPFLFFIRDNKLSTMIFEGRIEDPVPFVEVSAPPSPPLATTRDVADNNQRSKIPSRTQH